MKFALVAILACAGCDAVFNLDHVDLRIDAAGSDSRVIDADIPMCKGGDEDCDTRLNNADFCPADFDSASADDDADGVGNACDPDLTGPSPNHITFFDGFDNNTGGWNIAAGQWQLGDGELKQPDIGDTEIRKTVSMRYPGAEMIVTELATVANGSVTVYGKFANQDLRCSVIKRESDGAEFLDLAGNLLQGRQTALSGTGTLRITGGQHQNGEFFCSARHGNGLDATVTSGMSLAVTITTVGITTSSASATISSITLFDVP